MKTNTTSFPDLDQFDSTIPPTAEQHFTTETTYPVEDTTEFASVLADRDILSSQDAFQKRTLELLLIDADRDDNDYFQAESPVAVASYLYSPEDNTALIGAINVGDTFQQLGIGTRLKKHVDNHARQDGATHAYTWLATEAGERLAARTGYCPDTAHTPDYPEIWVKHYD